MLVTIGTSRDNITSQKLGIYISQSTLKEVITLLSKLMVEYI